LFTSFEVHHDFDTAIAFLEFLWIQFRSMMEYLTRWVEAQLVKDCTGATTTKFLFDYVLTRFGCPKVLMSDQGTHFLNETIREYHDLFPTKFSDLKGIIGELDIMKITLKQDTNPVKQRSYCLNLKYKENISLDLDKMLEAGIIELVEESDWVSPMVVQEKK